MGRRALSSRSRPRNPLDSHTRARHDRRVAIPFHTAIHPSVLEDHYRLILADCESPIEKRLMEQMLQYVMFRRRLSFIHSEHGVGLDADLVVQPQVWYRDCRLDFGILAPKTERACIVECDGYEFHRRKDRFERDRWIDARILTDFRGRIPIFRFSGSRITHEVDACYLDVLSYLLDP